MLPALVVTRRPSLLPFPFSPFPRFAHPHPPLVFTRATFLYPPILLVLYFLVIVPSATRISRLPALLWWVRCSPTRVIADLVHGRSRFLLKLFNRLSDGLPRSVSDVVDFLTACLGPSLTW